MSNLINLFEKTEEGTLVIPITAYNEETGETLSGTMSEESFKELFEDFWDKKLPFSQSDFDSLLEGKHIIWRKNFEMMRGQIMTQ